MLETHCTVKVTLSSENIFSYESPTSGWVVDTNGNITAPDPTVEKTITFEIDNPSEATFTAFQLSVFPDKETCPWCHASSLEGIETLPTLPSSPGTTAETFILIMPPESHCSYRLAVNGTWSHEPKIHNDGSD